MLVANLFMWPTGAWAADPAFSQILEDPPYDVVARRTDAGATLPFDGSAHRLIELVSIELGRWTPVDPQVDIFTGSFTPGGVFVRLDMAVAGLVNPPGSVDVSGFDPFRYGPHPVYGFLEIDVDDDNTTGGELDAPSYRYLGNVARFGGIPAGEEFNDRVAADGADFDMDITSEPYVERSGEEFHLALLGDQFANGDINQIAGDGDLVFESGETWVIEGHWFHRAHGFEPFSIAAGGLAPGEYAPRSSLSFAHDPARGTTLISLVFPLTNGGAAAQSGMPAEPMNHDPSDQASVNEAIRDLVISAGVIDMFPTGMPEEVLILPWKDKTSGQYLDPTEWRVTALLGTTYTQPGGFFVWTDVYPNPLRGDVNSENGASEDDREEIAHAIEERDADDGVVDGQVWLANHALDFSVFDVNHDGVIDSLDVMLVSREGDSDGDDDVDLADFAALQRCWHAPAASAGCPLLDLNADQEVDEQDLNWFQAVMGGPGGY